MLNSQIRAISNLQDFDSMAYLSARLLHIFYQLRPTLTPSRWRGFALDPSLDGAVHLLG